MQGRQRLTPAGRAPHHCGMDAPSSGLLKLLGEPTWCPAVGGRVEVPENLPAYLLGYLATQEEGAEREAVAALFWPERAQDQAHHNLRANLHRVRALLAAWGQADALRADRMRLHLRLPSDLLGVRQALRDGDARGALAALEAPLFACWKWRGFDALAAWARAEREALQAAVMSALQQSAQRLVERGDRDTAAGLLLRALALQPPDEALLCQLLPWARDAGCGQAALDAYDRLHVWLQRELGATPAEHTKALAARLRAALLDAHSAPALETRLALVAGGRVPRALIQPPRLIGRQAPQLLLANAQLPLVTLDGAPGVGKTRLLEEACPAARWLCGREAWQGLGLAPVVEYLQDHQDHLADVGEYRRDVARLWPAWADGELLPVADPQTARPRLLQGLALLLEQGGTALVVDDWQWMDATTVELVGLLAQRRRVSLRVAWREHELQGPALALWQQWQLAGAAPHVALSQWTLPDIEALLMLAEPGAVPAQGLGVWLLQRTGGNAFLVLQTLQALFESGQLGQAWQGSQALLQNLPEAQAPTLAPRVAELMRWRLRALSEPARRLLDVAAVQGRANDLPRLAQAGGMEAWQAAEALQECEHRGLVIEGRLAHDILRQVLLETLSPPRRRWLHAAVAQHFQALHTPAQQARHWWAAGREAEALQATEAAVHASGQAGLQAEALDLLHEALGATTDPAAQGQLLVLQAQAHLERGALAEALAAAEAALQQPLVPAQRVAALRVRASLARQDGQLDAAEQWLEQAAQYGPESDALLIDRAYVAVMRRDYERWIPALERAAQRLRQQAPGSELVVMLTSLAAVHNENGDVETGLALLREAWDLAAALKARYAQVEVAISMVWGLSALERHEEAVDLAGQALALGEFDSTPTLRNNRAWCLMELGRRAEAQREYEALRLCDDASLVLGATARLVQLHAEQGEAEALALRLDELAPAMACTQVVVVRAAALAAALNHGQEHHWRALLAQWQPASVDPWLYERVAAALQRHGLMPADYLLPPAADAEPG